jgi:hypothetical protein
VIRLKGRRLSDRGRHVIALADSEAQALRHSYVGTEHLLVALTLEEEGVAYGVLAGLGLSNERVRVRIVQIVGAGEVGGDGEDGHDRSLTPRAERVLEMALREALSVGHNYIDTEHILLALVRENEGAAARILLDEGADPEKVRRETLAALGWRKNQPQRLSIRQDIRQSGRVPPFHRGRPAGLDWRQATLLWRPEGVELRVPLHLNEGSIARFAADEVWAREPLTRLRRELWSGWLALASPTLLDDVDPLELRRLLDAAAKYAVDRSGRDRGRVEDFLHLLQEPPTPDRA